MSHTTEQPSNSCDGLAQTHMAISTSPGILYLHQLEKRQREQGRAEKRGRMEKLRRTVLGSLLSNLGILLKILDCRAFTMARTLMGLRSLTAV